MIKEIHSPTIEQQQADSMLNPLKTALCKRVLKHINCPPQRRCSLSMGGICFLFNPFLHLGNVS